MGFLCLDGHPLVAKEFHAQRSLLAEPIIANVFSWSEELGIGPGIRGIWSEELGIGPGIRGIWF